MFSSKFLNIISRQPSSAKALDLLAAYLEIAAAQQRLDKLRLDPKLIQQISKVESTSELAGLISLLLSEHILRRVVVVESLEVPRMMTMRLKLVTMMVSPVLLA